GSVDMNVQRWTAQFEGAKPPATKKEKVLGFDLTSLELEGTYTGGGGPMGPKVTKSGFKLLGAIVEGPSGPIFFKLTGPAKTVEAARADFQKMLKGITKQGREPHRAETENPSHRRQRDHPRDGEVRARGARLRGEGDVDARRVREDARVVQARPDSDRPAHARREGHRHLPHAEERVQDAGH